VNRREKQFRHIWLLLVALVLLFQGCEECSNCVPRKTEPSIRVNFYTDNALSEALIILDSLAFILEADRTLLDTIEFQYRDSLVAVIDFLVSDSTRFAERIANFRAGKTRVDQLGGIDMEQGSHFSDTLINRDFLLPLNASRDKSIYYFQYFGYTDTLALEYIRSIDQNLDGVRMKISDLKIDTSLTTFDSVRLRCKKNICSGKNSVVEIFF
jgi:hypothetical protein